MTASPGRRLLLIALVALAASVAVAAAAAATPVTRAQYGAMLKQRNDKVGKVERAAQLALARKAPRSELKRLLLAWAATEKDVGESFQKVRPPADAVSANTQLARGEIAYADDLTDAASRLPAKASSAIAYLGRALADSAGAKMVNQALTKLRIAGYY